MKSKLICAFTIATLVGSTGALKAAVFSANPARKSAVVFSTGDFTAESSFVSPSSIAAASGDRPGDQTTEVMKKKSSSKKSSKKSSSKAS